jgi:hypothetical protein
MDIFVVKKPGWSRDQLEEICAVKNKNFRGLKLHDVDFSGMNLEKADFRQASCHYANFSNTNCKFANFEGAGLMFTKWQGANCHRMNAKDASLCDADMRGVTDFFGMTLTMQCDSWKGLKVDTGFWYGFLFYGLLMDPPTEEDRDKLQIFFGPEKYEVLRNLYAVRQM